MKAIRNAKELDDILIKILKDVIQEVAEKINDKLRSRIDEDVYVNRNSYYHDKSRQPTYQFRESVTTDEVKVDGKEVSTKVYHDANKMELNVDTFLHGSRYWEHGEDVRELLPKIINDGLSGNLFGANQWWQEPRPYWTNTIKELESQGLIKKWFKEAMRKRGFKVG